ncbi:mitochondrial ribosomal small subunit component [Clavispora lusitaniae]|nr:mitochondrial ribosomal small subunit component [Clavispora lusitaniae]
MNFYSIGGFFEFSYLNQNEPIYSVVYCTGAHHHQKKKIETLVKSNAMYYELFAIARISDPVLASKEASKIASTVGKLILNNRGVIREITSLGPKPLPKIMSKEQERHFQGYHFMMGFDSSSAVQQELLRTLRRDPRILRSSIIKNEMKGNLNVGTTYQRVFEKVSN